MDAREATQLRADNILLQGLFEYAPDAIVVVDEGARIIRVNAEAEKMFGYGRAEILGRAIEELVPERFRRRHTRERTGYIDAPSVRPMGADLELYGRRKDGSEFPINVSLGPLRTETGRMVLSIIRDITEQKWAAEQVKLAKLAAEEANHAKSQFLANMSHELRTPLNAVIGYSELLQEEAEEAGHGHYIPDLQRIRGAGKQLLGLINDILDLSKIEAGKMELFVENFDLPHMVRDVVTTIRPMLEPNANRLELDLAHDLGMMGSDVTKVRQSLFNLLSNACKFTENGTISLDVRRERVGGQEWISFVVRDTGIGIAPEQRERLFREFSQADTSTTRKYGGTGLGLAISRHFCLILGGDISVESEPGRGAIFTIRLPADVQSRGAG